MKYEHFCAVFYTIGKIINKIIIGVIIDYNFLLTLNKYMYLREYYIAIIVVTY